MNSESAEAKLLRLRTQNSERQKKFYLQNAEKLKEARRMKYKAQADALKQQRDPPQIKPYEPSLDITKETAEDTWPKPFSAKDKYNTYQQIMDKLPEQDRAQYGSQLKTMFQILNNTKTFLVTIKNAQRVVDLLSKATKPSGEPYSVNSRKAYLQSLLKVITQLNLPVTTKSAQIYGTHFEIYRLDSSDIGKQKQATLSLITFDKYLKLIGDRFGKESKEYLLASLYDEMTLRDDFHLKIVETLKEADADLNEQYIIVPKAKTAAVTIIINKYKTDAKYGQINEKLSMPLSKMIRAYITANSIALNDYLFGKSASNGTFVSNMNKEAGLTGYTITTYRNMKASEIQYKSNEERVLLAQKMKHSPLMSLKYVRLIKD